MDSDRLELERLLKENGFTLVRTKRHLVYRNLFGTVWTVPKTPSDPAHSYKNNLAQFKRLLETGRAKDTAPKIFEFESDRAERVLHPEKIKPAKELKPRREVQKKYRAPVVTSPSVPSPVRAAPSQEFSFDLYKAGRLFEHALKKEFEAAFLGAVVEQVKKRKADFDEEARKMKSTGASYLEISTVAELKRSQAATLAYFNFKNIRALFPFLTRRFQRIMRDGKKRETESPVTLKLIEAMFVFRKDDGSTEIAESGKTLAYDMNEFSWNAVERIMAGEAELPPEALRPQKPLVSPATPPEGPQTAPTKEPDCESVPVTTRLPLVARSLSHPSRPPGSNFQIKVLPKLANKVKPYQANPTRIFKHKLVEEA